MTEQIAEELAGARATIDHMAKAMSWICGHDRQGLDHLEEAQYEGRSREAAAKQARAWAGRARTAEAANGRLRALADQWVKAGPPPLGVPLARWWDARLAELNAALDEPKDQP